MRSTLVPIGFALVIVLFVGAAFGVYVLTRPGIDLTLHNVGPTTIEHVNLVGPGLTVPIGSMEPGAIVIVSFDVERDGELHVLFTVEGQRRRVIASEYQTPNLDSDLEVELGPDAGVPYVVSVAPVDGR